MNRPIREVSAPHFFVEGYDHLAEGDTVVLSPSDSAHALRSRRLRPGEEVTVSNGTSWLGRGRLRGEREGLAVVELDAATPIVLPRSPEVDVAMAAPKGDRLPWAAQKLSELGVRELRVIATHRSVRAPSAGTMARLSVVAREAAMQAGQPVVMAVAEADGTPAAEPFDAAILLHGPSGDGLGEVLPAEARRLLLAIGPEGGFTDEEVRRASAAGYAVASLGPATFRTETAAVVSAALVLARYGRLG